MVQRMQVIRGSQLTAVQGSKDGHLGSRPGVVVI